MKPRLTLLILFFLSSICCLAEGTKQLRPDSSKVCQVWILDGSPNSYSCFGTEHCAPDQSLFIHIANPGEKIFMGFHGDNLMYTSFKIKLNGITQYTNTVYFSYGSPGNIAYYSQALAGPDILNPHGYPALTFTPPEPGDYCLQFPGSTIIFLGLFDITVIDTTKTPLVPINGRIWSKDWSFQIFDPFLGTMYVLTTDSVVTSINYNGMVGENFDVTSTANGCYPIPEPWDSSCRSRHGNHHYAEYKMFVNNPDSIEYPTGMLGKILGDTVNVTRSCNGTFAFSFVVNKKGTVKLSIEPNLAPGIQPGDISLNHAVLPGPNTILWNGINALGDSVPCGDSVHVTINYINGLTNLSLYDIEYHLKGFIIQPVRPPGQPIATYWNDTLLASDGGVLQLTGCYFTPPDSGCHKWQGNVGYGLGSQNTVNTWWYAASSELDLGRFSVACVPHAPQGISGPTTLCANTSGTYLSIPNPLAGSETLGYEWVLTDNGSGTTLLDSINIGSTVKISFSAYPAGQKRLKLRGRSDLCGMGLFGPGQGILINSLVTTQITNTQKSFTICSGDTTNILLQSTLVGTSYSYTANASAPSTTGYSAGIQNPIKQPLVNSGNNADTVFYHVVPFLDPCPGDTAIFMVIVNPTDTMNFLIAASANPACMGTVDTFSVTSLIGGPAASYQWLVNGTTTGSNLPVFIYVPVNGDIVQCRILSPDFCVPGKIAYSQEIIMNVTPSVTVGVTVVAQVNPTCKGDPVTLSAIPLNGGSSPVYQWKVNGVIAGTNTAGYSYVPVNGDTVICLLTSDLSCVLNSKASDTLQIIVKEPLQVVDTILCWGTPYYAQGAWQTTGGTYHDTLVPPVSCVRYIETKLSYKPPIAVNLGNDTTICGNTINLSPHFPGGTYIWQDGSTDSVYVATRPGEYSVLVHLDGCFHGDSIIIGECPVYLRFPSAFTPNGDGLNDTFHPVGNGVEKFSIQIYNHWGEMIFETSAMEPGWDGTYRGAFCPEGTYVFKVSFEGSSGGSKQVTGTITLLK